jgi:hypothetical protein
MEGGGFPLEEHGRECFLEEEEDHEPDGSGNGHGYPVHPSPTYVGCLHKPTACDGSNGWTLSIL